MKRRHYAADAVSTVESASAARDLLFPRQRLTTDTHPDEIYA